jgi:hypothetical protein
LSWFMSYLYGRSQETRFGEKTKELDLVFRRVLSWVHFFSFCTLMP